MYKWYFPKEKNPRRKGLGHAGIETFRGKLVGSLVREIIQNSLDALAKEKEIVEVEFKYFEVQRNLFPDIDKFLEIFQKSYEQSKIIKSSKQMDFFNQGIKVLNSNSIPFLRISDYNTTGLTGSQSGGDSPWRNLVMADGISTKGSEAGGSFGIGKNAPFACSSLNTVFYSTLDIENVEAFQGFANLITIDEEDGLSIIGEGYFANDDNKNPIRAQANLETGYRRTIPGTDIYIAGLIFEKEKFRIEAITSILNNYLYAIYDKKLDVRIGETMITSENLFELVSMYSSDLDKETVEFMDLLVNKKASKFDDFDDGNQATLYLMIQEDGSRKISAIRKPWMKIKNFDGFSRGMQFKGAIIFHGQKTNEILRSMENPAHNNWETDRISDSTKKNISINLLDRIKRYINDKIMKLIDLDYSDYLDLDGAANYIQLVGDDSISKTKKSREKVSKIDVVKKPEMAQKGNKKVQDYDIYVEEGDEEKQFDDKVTRGGGVDLSGHPPSTLTDIKKGKLVSYKMSQVKLLKISPGHYRLFYESDTDQTIVNFQIFALFEEGIRVDYFNIINAYRDNEMLSCAKNYITNVKIDGRIAEFDFITDIKIDLSLGVAIYEIG